MTDGPTAAGHAPARGGLRAQHAGAVLVLLGVAASWGAAYVVVKDVLPLVPVSDFLLWRFAAAVVVLLLLRPAALRRLTREGWVAGGVVGLPLAAGYLLQTVGLRTTPASVSAFLTGLFVVITPLLAGWLLHERVPARVWLAVAVATAGLAGLTLHGFSAGRGELLTLLCAVCFALHVLALARYAPHHDAYGLALVQLGVVAAAALVLAAPGGVALPQTAAVWQAVLGTAVAATAVAYLGQSWAQRRLSASRTALVLTTEPVFAALAAVLAGQELLGARVLVGGALVLVAMLLAEGLPGRDRRDGPALLPPPVRLPVGCVPAARTARHAASVPAVNGTGDQLPT